MKLRVVVMEDDDDLRKLLAMILETMGHEVLAFADPGACPIYTRGECTCPTDALCGDILITDNRMPTMSGLEFIQRQIAAGCKGIVANKAVMSSLLDEDDIAMARAIGCRVFSKPFQLAELQQWICERERSIDSARRLAVLH